MRLSRIVDDATKAKIKNGHLLKRWVCKVDNIAYIPQVHEEGINCRCSWDLSDIVKPIEHEPPAQSESL